MRSQNILAALAACICFSSQVNAVEPRLLPAEEWLMPRSGERLLDWPPLAATVREWMDAETPSRIVIEYPGGEQGSLWVAELTDWLVTLGIPAAAIHSRPGGRLDGLTIWVEPLDERASP